MVNTLHPTAANTENNAELSNIERHQRTGASAAALPILIAASIGTVPAEILREGVSANVKEPTYGRASIRAVAFWNEVERLHAILIERKKGEVKCRDSLEPPSTHASARLHK